MPIAYTMLKIQLHILTSFFFLTLLPSWAQAEEVVAVAWRIKAPYQYIENGIEKGYLLEQTKQIFAQARIATQFKVEPSKRIWSNFAAGTKNYCSFDWFKNPERELMVQFSLSLHATPPYSVLIGPAATAQVSAHTHIRSLLADPGITLGVVDSVTYGPELDAMINASKNRIERNNVLPMIMARMVAADRASFMFIDKREWEYLKSTDKHLQHTTVIDLPGIPAGINSYIVCSKDLTPGQMRRINAAIQQIGKFKKTDN